MADRGGSECATLRDGKVRVVWGYVRHIQVQNRRAAREMEGGAEKEKEDIGRAT